MKHKIFMVSTFVLMLQISTGCTAEEDPGLPTPPRSTARSKGEHSTCAPPKKVRLGTASSPTAPNAKSGPITGVNAPPGSERRATSFAQCPRFKVRSGSQCRGLVRGGPPLPPSASHFSAGEVGEAHEELVNGPGTLATFPDGPYNERLAASHVSGGKDGRGAGLVVL